MMCLQESSFDKTIPLTIIKVLETRSIESKQRVISLAAKIKASPVWAQHEQTNAIEKA